jgi:pimeloyl-ACP methyl ester carboxylesterase
MGMKHNERGDDEAKPKRPRFWLVATVFALSMATSGCRTEGDYLFLEREGAIMPVWVRGNVESGTFVLIVHGGPGSTSQQWVDLPSFQAFEKRYAIAYWDQRGAGTSQGTPPSTSYTVDDAVADTDAVVALLRSRYEVKRFFILAHSWGGFVATAWLLDPAHQVGVDGYVMVSGDFAPVEGVDLARQFVLEYAKAQVDAGAADWQPAVNWAAAPVPTNTDLQTLTRWYQTLGKYINLAERSRTAMAEDAAQARFHATLERDLFLFSPFDTFQALWNESDEWGLCPLRCWWCR